MALVVICNYVSIFPYYIWNGESICKIGYNNPKSSTIEYAKVILDFSAVILFTTRQRKRNKRLTTLRAFLYFLILLTSMSIFIIMHIHGIYVRNDSSTFIANIFNDIVATIYVELFLCFVGLYENENKFQTKLYLM